MSNNGVLLLADADAFPEELETEHLVLIIVPLMLVFASWLVTGVFAFRSKLRMPYLLMQVVCTALLLVGIISWVVTYLQARDVIEENQVKLLRSTASTMVYALREELEAGVYIVEWLQRASEDGNFNFTGDWPSPELAIAQQLYTVGTSASSILSIYYGTERGTAHGVDVMDSLDLGNHFITPQPGDHLPPWITCLPADYDDDLPVGGKCADIAASGGCSGPDGNDPARLCMKACMNASSPAEAQDYCYGSDAQPRYIVVTVKNRKPGSSDETFLPADGHPKYPSSAGTFDPRGRPWYSSSKEAFWSEPYLLVQDGQGTGTTVSAGVTTRDGVFLGTVAVDYTLGSFGAMLYPLKPTENSVSFLLKGKIVIGSTFLEAELEQDTGIPRTHGVFLDTTKFPNRESRMLKLTTKVEERFGSVELATQGGNTLMMVSGEVLLSVPVHIRGGMHLLLVVSIPMTDVMGKANDASVMSLVLAIVISVACTGAMFVVVLLLLHPLKNLQSNMMEVANMQLEGHVQGKTLSRISEIGVMELAFLRMARNLMEYRQYLPQSLLCQHNSEEEGGSEAFTKVSSDDNKTESGSASGSSALSSKSSAIPVNNAVFDAHLCHRQVSIVLFNMKDFHGSASSMPKQSLLKMHTKFVEPMLQVRMYRGIVNFFSGDHVMLSFNTVLRSRDHCHKALAFSYDVITVLNKPAVGKPAMTANAAVVSGGAVQGNIGCTGMKNYCVIGPTLVSALVLERWGAAQGYSVLCDAAIASFESNVIDYEQRLLCRAYLTKRRSTYVFVVEGMKSANEGEWMYNMEVQSKYQAYNEALTVLHHADYSKAATALEKAKQVKHDDKNFSELLTDLEALIKDCEAKPAIPKTVRPLPLPLLHSNDITNSEGELSMNEYDRVMPI